MSRFESEVIVSGFALRQALAAVLPHVGTGDCQEAQKQVRLVVDCRVGLVTVLASGIGAVAASVPVKEARISLEPVVDVLLTPSVVKLILAATKGAGLDEQLLSLGWSGQLWVTDVSGLLDGHAVRVHAFSWLEEGLLMPDVAANILKAAGLPLAGSATVALRPSVIKRWSATARALGSWPLRVTTSDQFLVVAGSFGSTENSVFVGADWCPGACSQIAAPRALDEPVTLTHLERLRLEQGAHVAGGADVVPIGGAR